MITKIQTEISQYVNLALIRVITEIRLAENVCFYAGATIMKEGQGTEADQGWGHFPVPQGSPDKATLTLEVNVSESHIKLRRNVD